jgi:ABC-type bacteriocin/lantibiotic exporter with double-glycine peptidase domain
MEYIVEGVPYYQQPDQRTCWNASYKMILAYGCRKVGLADELPNNAKMRERGILDSEFPICRNALGLTSTRYTALKTVDGLKNALELYGPIWCSGFWCDGAKHIVIVRGIREGVFSKPEVYVNDPYRAITGAEGRPSWWTFSRFSAYLNPVPFACQHWT